MLVINSTAEIVTVSCEDFAHRMAREARGTFARRQGTDLCDSQNGCPPLPYTLHRRLAPVSVRTESVLPIINDKPLTFCCQTPKDNTPAGQS